MTNTDTDWHKLFLDAKTLLDARDAEVKRLTRDMEHCAQIVNDGGYGKLDAENKRLREALERFVGVELDTMDEDRLYEIQQEVRESLKAQGQS